jgi:hypothetical protein
MPFFPQVSTCAYLLLVTASHHFPYNSTYLGTVLYPFKYVKHIATKREFLYNLATDPLEMDRRFRLRTSTMAYW